MPSYVREFVLTQEVENVSSLEEGVEVCSEEEEHFGVPWKLGVKREGAYLSPFLYCLPRDRSKEWSIQIERTFKLISVKGKTLECIYTRYHKNTDDRGYGRSQIISWNDLMKDYVVDDMITIQVHFLADQSSYFEALFLRNFSESEQSEIKLSDVDSKDFQNFLELLHGEAAIDDTTVDGILKLSDMYDAKTAIRRCEEFLIKESEKTMKEKLGISTKYKLENLKADCLLKIVTIDDIESVLPGKLSELDPDVSNALLQKSISLHQ